MWKEVIERQSEIGLLELAADLPCLHVDHPDRTDTVPGSVGLLRLARAAGLDVPRTLVSNHPDDIRAFVAGCKGGSIRKMLHSSSMIVQTDEGEQRGTTEAVTEEDLVDDATLAPCPMVWQERVPKERELRITVVGHRLFVASVRSSDSDVLHEPAHERRVLPPVHVAHERVTGMPIAEEIARLLCGEAPARVTER